MLSKASENAIKATIYLASLDDKERYVPIAEIAEAIESPVQYCSKIMNQLRRKGLIESSAGARGGFRLGPNRHISFYQVVEAQEETIPFDRCILGLKQCSSLQPCPAHEQYKGVKEELIRVLTDSYVDDFTHSILEQKLNLK